jgi:hypothetical protein
LGGLLGLLLYGINFYGFTAVFPWFAEGRSWVSMFTHIVFGMIHGCGCKTMMKPSTEAAPAPTRCGNSRADPSSADGLGKSHSQSTSGNNDPLKRHCS